MTAPRSTGMACLTIVLVLLGLVVLLSANLWSAVFPDKALPENA